MIKSFLAPFDTGAIRAELAGIVAWKVTDARLSGAERHAMIALARQQA
jgi:hypothetical protein